MAAKSFRRLQLDWNSILCAVFALASHNSEAFATSFRPAAVRGGAIAQKDVLANPNNNNNNNNRVEHHQRVSLFSTQPSNGYIADDVIDATYVAETNLPTDAGNFRLRAYRTAQSTNKFAGNEPCVIYNADNSPFGVDGQLREGVPVRVHDQCLTSEVFGSNR